MSFVIYTNTAPTEKLVINSYPFELEILPNFLYRSDWTDDGPKNLYDDLIDDILQPDIDNTDYQNNEDLDDKESNTQQRGKFKIHKAVKYLRELATAKSRHRCAFAVRTAMEKGNLKTNGRPLYGGLYIPFLLKKGWEIVNDEPQAGDIAVTVPHGSHKYGHISMYDGNQWISDFRLRSKYVYKTANDENTKVLRYRG